MRLAAVVPLAIACILFAATSVESQDPSAQRRGGPGGEGPGRISGRVTDGEGQALSGVGVTIQSASDSAVVTEVATESGGAFRIVDLPLGSYTLGVSLIGYRPRNSEVIELNEEQPEVDLGEIVLEVAPVELDAVEADAERSAMVVEADRTVYNTDAMPAAEGTAIDVLRAVPELEIDVEDNVKLRGNQSVQIHMNGRPAPLQGEQLANFLRQLPGDQIDRVEVMPNPSAKHDPEGSGGIVNIVLKEDLNLGLSGSVSANASTRNRQYFNGRLNYQRGRLTMFTGAGVSTYRNEMSFYDRRQNLVTDPVTILEQNGTSDNRGRGANLDWTIELKVGEQAHLWSNAWMYGSRNDSDGLTEYGLFDADMTPRDRYDRTNDGESFWGSMDIGLGFVQLFEPQKEELRIDGRFSSGADENDARNSRAFFMGDGQPVELPVELTLNDVESGNGNLSIQADYFRPLGGGKIEVGYRASRRDQDDDNLLRIFESPESQDPRERMHSGYDYQETFHSAYVTLSHPIGKFSIQGGLRGENASTYFESRVTDDEIDRTYTTLYPSLSLSYSPQQGRTLRLQYSRRVRRPNAWYLNPVVPSTDPLNISVGNPQLDPSYTDSYSLDFSLTGRLGTVRVAPFYRRTTDIWERIRRVDTDGVATSRWENSASADQLGSNFTLSLASTGRVSGSANFSLYRDARDGTNISSDYQRAALMWSLYGSLGYKFTSTLTAQAYAYHFPAQSILQGRASGYTYTRLGIRQQLWDGKGSISLNIDDPLNLYNFSSSTRDATYIQTSRSSYETRVFMLGFTFNFGNAPEQHSRRGEAEEGGGETIRVR